MYVNSLLNFSDVWRLIAEREKHCSVCYTWFSALWLRTVRSLVLVPASLAGCSSRINTRTQWCQFADIGMLAVFLVLLCCIRFLSQCKNRHSSKLVHVFKVQTCSLSLNFIRFIIICKMFHAHLFNLLSSGPVEPGVTEAKWLGVSCSLLVMLSSLAQKLLWLSSSLGKWSAEQQRAEFPGRLNSWSVFGAALMRESPEPLGTLLMSQRKVLGEGSGRCEGTADLL